MPAGLGRWVERTSVASSAPRGGEGAPARPACPIAAGRPRRGYPASLGPVGPRMRKGSDQPAPQRRDRATPLRARGPGRVAGRAPLAERSGSARPTPLPTGGRAASRAALRAMTTTTGRGRVSSRQVPPPCGSRPKPSMAPVAGGPADRVGGNPRLGGRLHLRPARGALWRPGPDAATACRAPTGRTVPAPVECPSAQRLPSAVGWAISAAAERSTLVPRIRARCRGPSCGPDRALARTTDPSMRPEGLVLPAPGRRRPWLARSARERRDGSHGRRLGPAGGILVMRSAFAERAGAPRDARHPVLGAAILASARCFGPLAQTSTRLCDPWSRGPTDAARPLAGEGCTAPPVRSTPGLGNRPPCRGGPVGTMDHGRGRARPRRLDRQGGGLTSAKGREAGRSLALGNPTDPSELRAEWSRRGRSPLAPRHPIDRQPVGSRAARAASDRGPIPGRAFKAFPVRLCAGGRAGRGLAARPSVWPIEPLDPCRRRSAATDPRQRSRRPGPNRRLGRRVSAP